MGQVPAVRMANEAELCALAAEVTNGVVVDIGESGIYVTPIFDGFPISEAVQSEACGGADITNYLDYMLLSRTNESYNQMVSTVTIVTLDQNPSHSLMNPFLEVLRIRQ